MPTLKQKRVFQRALENGGNVTQAMKEVGYKQGTIHNPNNVTESDGWKLLMDKHLPDSILAKKHREGLNATTKKPHLIDRDDKGRPIYDYVKEDDYSVRHRYLETAYKIKGKIKEDGGGSITRILVLPAILIKKNGIPISEPNTEPGGDSPRLTPIQGDTGRQKIRQDGAKLPGDSR